MLPSEDEGQSMSATPFRDEGEVLALRSVQDEPKARGDGARVLSLTAAQPERGADPKRTEADRLPRRDYSAALNLIGEAQETLRLTEERTQELEAQIQEMAQLHREELARAQTQITQLEHRAKLAERRADDAEGWLDRMNQAITTAFGRR